MTVDEVVRVVVPAGVTLLGTIAIASLGQLRRTSVLRRGLGLDATFEPSLRGVPRGLLDADMSRRVVQLVALSRYPALTIPELAAVAYVLTVTVAITAGAIITRFEPASPNLYLTATVSAGNIGFLAPVIYVAMRTQGLRMLGRLTFIEHHLEPDVIHDLSVSMRLETWLLKGIILVSVVGASETFAGRQLLAVNQPSWVEISVTLAVATVPLWPCVRALRDPALARRLPDAYDLGLFGGRD